MIQILLIIDRVYAIEQNMYTVNSKYLVEDEYLWYTDDYDLFNYLQKAKTGPTNKVSIQLYYESLCTGCIEFITENFTTVVERLNSYLTFQTYPYGNAKTFRRNGRYEFKCQHGLKECYGNKLHACAIDLLQNVTQAVIFNSCMMEPKEGKRGSNDYAADACAKKHDVDAAPIKECAKGDKGSELLKYYGDETKRANVSYVPLVGKASERVTRQATSGGDQQAQGKVPALQNTRGSTDQDHDVLGLTKSMLN
ncbi:unnamed protein product, partial [Iphiclides podalirius]